MLCAHYRVRTAWRFVACMAWLSIWCASASEAADKAEWIKSAGSGSWSAVATWENGKPPAAGARVHIQPGHIVTYDIQSDQPIRAIYVAGTLAFAHDRDTRLDVGLIKIEAGEEPS